MPVETTAAGAAVLEIERFEWVRPDRIEIVGYWTGLRGKRFMRPTLVLKGEGEPKRLLALLEHKPWIPDDGQEWVAAFAWGGDVVKFESAELNVGSGIDLKLPPPRMRPGKPRRFRQRVTVHDATREAEAAASPRSAGIVSDPPAKPAAKPPEKATAKPATKSAAKPPAKAKAKPAAAATADVDATQPLQADTGPDLQGDLDAATAESDRLRSQRDELRRERDQALEKLRVVRGELEAERQARERAVNDGRAAERESANRMLGEGAELRAAVERQREIAYLERDDAKTARDEAIADRDKACEERDAALAESKEARRDRKEAFAQRDRAVKLRERADADRAQALAEREQAIGERDEATKERDEILRVHERGLPVHPPKPRFLPEDHEERSDLEIWAPRGAAIGVLVILAFIVLRLFAGL